MEATQTWWNPSAESSSLLKASCVSHDILHPPLADSLSSPSVFHPSRRDSKEQATFRSELLSRLLFFLECCVCCGWLIGAGNYVAGQVSVNGCIFCFSSAPWTPPSLSEVRHCLNSLGLLTNYTQPFMSTRAAPWRLDLPITSTTVTLNRKLCVWGTVSR